MKEIILEVPLLKQPDGSQHCAVASMRMLMAYNGENLSHEEIIKHFPEINKTRIGITPATARFLVENGYNVNYFSHQDFLLDDHSEEKTEKDLKFFQDKAETLESGSNVRLQLEQIIKLIEVGGKFSTRLLTLNNINDYLEDRKPVRVGIKPSILLSDQKYKFNHAVVIAGMRGDEYLINDPSPKSKEPYWVKKEKLLEAWSANGFTLLVVEKKR